MGGRLDGRVAFITAEHLSIDGGAQYC